MSTDVLNHVANLEHSLQQVLGSLAKANKRIEELEDRYNKQTMIAQAFVESRDQRIEALESLLSEAIAVFDKYLNVPEATEVKARWAELKAQ